MRNISVNGVRYRYRVGKTFVVIRNETKRLLVSCADVVGCSQNTWERGQWKKTQDGMVTPSRIAAFIKGQNEVDTSIT